MISMSGKESGSVIRWQTADLKFGPPRAQEFNQLPCIWVRACAC